MAATIAVREPAAASSGRRLGLELAEVVRAYAGRLQRLTPVQTRAARAIAACRTEALGGHAYVCGDCGRRHVTYNPCRNRHCPKCQGLEQVRWLEARKAELLPITYFHVVFTIPRELHPFFYLDPRRAYALLFAAAAETLGEVARNPKRLGAEIGITAVLHTWTQTLLFHPHVHCIVTGGGLDPAGDWVASHPRFFLPIHVLSEVFQGKLLHKLEQAAEDGLLDAPVRAAQYRREASRKSWVVYSKPPFAGPEQVLRYLARYTHRIAISNERLVAMSGDQVTFRWKDRRQDDAKKVMTLPAVEFLQRFFRHVLPSGFVRIRHYGLLANGVKRARLARARAALGAATPAPPVPSVEKTWLELFVEVTGRDPLRCPACRKGRLTLVAEIPPHRAASPPRGPP